MSAVLIKNASVYSPDPLGTKDILIIDERIISLGDNLQAPTFSKDCTVIDAKGRTVVPGFIDGHVHITGGGGEAGCNTLVPPVQLSNLIEAGITTVCGLLGTDTVTRNMISVLAKAKGLNDEGVTCFIVSGGYPLPTPVITEDLRTDITVFDEVRGGKMALADHRVSPVSVEEFLQTATEARIGGMLCGYPGMLVIHVGDAKEGLKIIFDSLDKAPHLARHIIVTHVNRNEQLFHHAVKLTKLGGYLDVTSGITNTLPNVSKPSQTIKRAYEHGVTDNLLMSSDGNGSMARYDADGKVRGLIVASLKSLHSEFVDCITQEKLSVTQALCPVTKNPAQAFSLKQKGEIKLGADADILILGSDYSIDNYIARGTVMMREKELIKKGTFEE